MRTRRLLAFSLLLAAIALALVALPARADTHTVVNTDDNTPGSLRQAIAAASAGDTINFSLTYPTTITLTTGWIMISKNLTIDGPGAGNLTIKGNDADILFYISGGAMVSFSGLTFSRAKGGSIYNSNAKAAVTDCVFSDNHGSGGGIYNYRGPMTVANSTFSNNDGGALYNASGTITVTNSTFSSNRSTSSGGAIYNSSGNLIVASSTFTDNGGTSGGAIYAYSGTVMLTDSMLTNNGASGGGAGTGGALYSSQGNITITNSSLSGNTAGTNGGAIYTYLGTLTFFDVTMSGNSATGNGGGLYNNGAVTLTNTTLSGNTATGSGGGFYNQRSATLTNVTLQGNSGGGFFQANYTYTTALFKNSIVANNSPSNCTLNKPLTSAGYNLSSDGSCSSSFGATGDLNYTNPMLGPLALNPPGSTQTHALLAGSPAIDAGTNTGCPSTDQRGVTRPLDGDRNGSAICDIGAYEVNPPKLYLPLIVR